eukprot:COSAG05_NODE_1472_length_4791_cov_13.982413_4_plen_240_part_00
MALAVRAAGIARGTMDQQSLETEFHAAGDDEQDQESGGKSDDINCGLTCGFVGNMRMIADAKHIKRRPELLVAALLAAACVVAASIFVIESLFPSAAGNAPASTHHASNQTPAHSAPRRPPPPPSPPGHQPWPQAFYLKGKVKNPGDNSHAIGQYYILKGEKCDGVPVYKKDSATYGGKAPGYLYRRAVGDGGNKSSWVIGRGSDPHVDCSAGKIMQWRTLLLTMSLLPHPVPHLGDNV